MQFAQILTFIIMTMVTSVHHYFITSNRVDVLDPVIYLKNQFNKFSNQHH